MRELIIFYTLAHRSMLVAAAFKFHDLKSVDCIAALRLYTAVSMPPCIAYTITLITFRGMYQTADVWLCAGWWQVGELPC